MLMALLSAALLTAAPNLPALYQLMQKAIAEKNLAEARRISSELLSKGPQALPSPLVYYDISLQMILLEIDLGSLSGARKQLEMIEKQEVPAPVRSGLLFARAHLAAKEKGAQAAMRELVVILERVPFIDWPQSEKLFHHTVCHTQNTRLDDLMAKADEAFKNRLFAKALERYDALLATVEEGLYPKATKNPRIETHIRFYKAKSLAYLGEHAKAIDQYARITDELQLEKEALQIRFELGVSLSALGQHLSASSHFSHVAKETKTSDPFYFRSRLLLAQSMQQLGDIEKASQNLYEIEQSHKLCTSQKILKKAAFLALELTELGATSHKQSHLDFAEAELLKLPQDDAVAAHLAEVWRHNPLTGSHKIAQLLKNHLFSEDEKSAYVRFLLVQTLPLDKALEQINVFRAPHLIQTKSAILALLWIAERALEEGRALDAESSCSLALKHCPDELRERASMLYAKALQAL